MKWRMALVSVVALVPLGDRETVPDWGGLPPSAEPDLRDDVPPEERPPA